MMAQQLAHSKLKPNQDVPDDLESLPIRPLGVAGVIRKLAFKLAINSVVTTAGQYFGNLQLGVNRKHGMDIMYHSIVHNMEMNPTHDTVLIDASNAFGNIRRSSIVKVLADEFPSLQPIFLAAYGDANILWYNAFSEGLYKILQDTGVLQGCSSGSFFFSIGIHPLLQQLQNKLHNLRDVLKAYIDDIVVDAETSRTQDLLRTILQEGPNTGVFMNTAKTLVLLGKCDSSEQAFSTFESYRELLHLSHEDAIRVVLIHPDHRNRNNIKWHRCFMVEFF